jgi:hypothetical protein
MHDQGTAWARGRAGGIGIPPLPQTFPKFPKFALPQQVI